MADASDGAPGPILPQTSGPRASGRGALRWSVLALAGAECLAALAMIAVLLGGEGSDPLGQAIARGVATVIALPLVLGALPALLLGILGRWLPLALLLAVAAPLALLVLMHEA